MSHSPDPIMDYINRFQQAWGKAQTFFEYIGNLPETLVDFVWLYHKIPSKAHFVELKRKTNQIILFVTDGNENWKKEGFKWIVDLLGADMKIWRVWVWQKDWEKWGAPHQI